MKIIRPGTIEYHSPSVFLAGPTIRDSKRGTPWRREAEQIFSGYFPEGALYIPEPFNPEYDFSHQVLWEDIFLNHANCILFWIPRDLETLPGFTTNIEFGEWMKSGKIVLGYPEDALKMRYLLQKASQYNVPTCHTLKGAVYKAISMAQM